jgi:hypothetical protein
MSGEITITPGYQLAAGERVNNSKLNQLGQPVGQVNAGSIGQRELIADDVRAVVELTGYNLFTNGNFNYWRVPDDYGTSPPGTGTASGVVPSGRAHEYNSAARWVIANDANRVASRIAFDNGQTDVPGNPGVFLRWTQTAALSGGINPGYFGQRIGFAPALSQRVMTFVIWVRADQALTVTPVVRQFFGDPASTTPIPSADVRVAGAPLNLAANIWTKLVQTFTVPDTSTKLIAGGDGTPAHPGSFTEFRVEAPQGIPFILDFANAQLVYGNSELSFENRPFIIDWFLAQRYRQRLGMVLFDSFATGKASVMCPINPRVPLLAGNLSLIIQGGGTGGTIVASAFVRGLILQNTVHSIVSEAEIFVDQELHAPF